MHEANAIIRSSEYEIWTALYVDDESGMCVVQYATRQRTLFGLLVLIICIIFYANGTKRNPAQHLIRTQGTGTKG